jgi:hypothetical protein
LRATAGSFDRLEDAVSRSAWVTIGLIVTFLLAFPAAAGAQGKPGGGGGGPGGGGGGGGGQGGGGGGSSTPTGNDVSYPQCGSQLPSGPAFAIVGVNGGLANDENPCLGPSSSYQSELAWAATSTVGGTSQPNVQLYVNTADPGNTYNGTLISDWPTSSMTQDPYGNCTNTTVTISSGTYTVGENSDACAWQYGYNMATQDTGWFTSAADAINSVSVPDTASSYQWWLDVETANSWQSDQTMNVADLEGMVAALAGAPLIGIYSTSSQWDTITGGTPPSSSSLYKLAQWVPGANTLSQAQQACTTATSFTGGTIAITQWRGNPDNDNAC